MKRYINLLGTILTLSPLNAVSQTADYGDAPDGGTFNGAPLNFNSLAANEGPRHTGAASSTFWIAQNRFLLVPDTEPDSRQVNQDIDNGQPFIFVNLLAIPAPAKVTVPVSTSASHSPAQTLYLNVAVDVDDDYDYENNPDANWVIKNRAFTMPADTTIGITSDWFGFGSNLVLFPVWLRATVTSTPVTSGWHDGTSPNAYGSGETEDWFYTFGQESGAPPEWKNPPRDPDDPTNKKKKRKPKNPPPTKCIKLKYPKVVYVKCDEVKCFTIEVRNCDGVDIKDVKIDFEFAGGVPLPGPPTPAGPADVDANKKKKFVICVFGWPCQPTQEVRWARYTIKLKYDPEGLYEEEVFDLVFGSGETPWIDSSLVAHLACTPAIDTLDSPVWDGEEGSLFTKHLLAFTGRNDFGMRWILGTPILVAKKMPAWMTLTQIPSLLIDTTIWELSGTPPMNALGMDEVIVTVTSNDPNDTLLVEPLDFAFPLHINMDNSPPTLDQTFPTTLTVTSGTPLTQAIIASDPDLDRGRRDTLWIDYFFVDPAEDTVVDLSTVPTLTDHGDGTADFDWTPTEADVGSYRLITVVWDYSFEVDSSVTDLSIVTGAEDPATLKPAFKVLPNPLSDEAVISFVVPHAAWVSFEVADATGRVVHEIPPAIYSAGATSVDWNASQLQPGIYHIRLKSANYMLTGRAVIAR
jgi:hypothetical protein